MENNEIRDGLIIPVLSTLSNEDYISFLENSYNLLNGFPHI